MDIHCVRAFPETATGVEVVERKGRGHPDTLADALAEHLSRSYSNYTLGRFGLVLHHNFDKVGILGGVAEAAFGAGRLTRPIRIMLNGRASTRFADETMPVRDILSTWAREFMVQKLPRLDPSTDLELQYNVSSGSSPGQVGALDTPSGSRKHWFAPRDRSDLRELSALASNDTSAGVAYHPLSVTERCVLTIERTLTSPEYQRCHAWLGTDIKVMACRTGTELDLTLCIPQIAAFVPDISAYRANVAECRRDIEGWAREIASPLHTRIFINTSDNYNIPELYLTVTGSAIESGDEGLVGRGNRANGLISMCRPFSMEGACGKNPIYHAGKVYNALAQDLARQLSGMLDATVAVWIIGQRGRLLSDPWKVVVAHAAAADDTEQCVEHLVGHALSRVSAYSRAILAGEVELY